MPLSRRSLLLWGGVAALTGGCLRRETGEPGAGVDGAIDVHAHVFNASDVPVDGFVRRVLLHDDEEQRLPETDVATEGMIPALAGLLVRLLSARTPTADEELYWMSLESEPPAPDDSRFERLLAEALSETLEPADATGLESGSPGRDAFRAQVLSETGIEVDAAQPGMEEVAGRLVASEGFVGRHIRWARLMTSSRGKIVGEYNRLYGGSSGADLFTPALVDMTLWLDGTLRSPLSSQIRVTEALQRRSGVAMHAFAPFDPWREARDDAAGRPDYATWREAGARDPDILSALGLAQWAVEEMGFIGVKLYPPMGFRPAGNAKAIQTYPARAIEEFPTDFPQRIDAALERLYAWCAAAGVPILAHAADSQGAAEGYGERAHPANWAPVVRDHPDLRICLAHFGDSLTGTLSDSWDAAVGALMEPADSRVFADLSHHSPALHGDLARQAAGLARFAERHDPELRHLLFGTDWSMLGREKGHEEYLGRIELLLRLAGVGEQRMGRLFRANAVTYLGLSEGEPAFARLERYYQRLGLDFERIRELTRN